MDKVACPSVRIVVRRETAGTIILYNRFCSIVTRCASEALAGASGYNAVEADALARPSLALRVTMLSNRARSFSVAARQTTEHSRQKRYMARKRTISGNPGASSVKILVIDVGGTNIKLLATGQEDPRKFPS